MKPIVRYLRLHCSTPTACPVPGRDGILAVAAIKESAGLATQSWSPQALGFERGDGDVRVEAETVVITGPCGDACVYVSTQLLYHVRAPNRRFFLDVAAQHMRGEADAAQYEGRDTADEEAFDYEVAGALARLRAVASRLGGAEAERIARRLHDFSAELRQDEATTPTSPMAMVAGRNCSKLGAI